MVSFVFLLSASVVGHLSGCSESVSDSEANDAMTGAVVETLLSASEVEAGTTVGVSCIVRDADNQVLSVPTTISAPSALIVSADTVHGTQPGSYEIRCTVPGATLPEQSATLTVTAGPPMHLTVHLEPAQEFYHIGDEVTLHWSVSDAFGNSRADLDMSLSPPVAGVEEDPDGAFRFKEDGRFEFTVTLAAPFEALSASIEALVDTKGPKITIKSPERGITILGEGAAVEVLGRVTDTVSGVSSLHISGTEVAVDSDGSFAALITPKWGLNALMVEAIDRVGNSSLASPTFQYSSKYVSFDDQDAAGIRIPDGVSVMLGHDFLDNGVPSDHIDDVASLLATVLNTVDTTAIAASMEPFDLAFPLLESSYGLSDDIALALQGNLLVNVAVTDLQLGTAAVSLGTHDGGLDATIDLRDKGNRALTLELDVSLELPLDVGFTFKDIPVTATISAAASFQTSATVDDIFADMDIDVGLPTGGELTALVNNLDLDIGGMLLDPLQDAVFTFSLEAPGGETLSFDLRVSDYFDLTKITDAILDPLTIAVVPAVTDALEPTISEFASEAIAGFLSSFEIDRSIELPELYGLKARSIDIYTDLTHVDFNAIGGTAGLSLGAWTEAEVTRPNHGALRRDGCLGTLYDDLIYDWARPLGVAMRTDALNAALFAVWRSGYLNGTLDLSEMTDGLDLPVEVSDLEVTLDFLLPPSIDDCNPAQGLVIELGDLVVDLSVTLKDIPIEARLFIDMALELRFEPGTDGLHINFGEVQLFHVEVDQLNRTHLGVLSVQHTLEEALAQLVEDKLTTAALGPYKLPVMDLSTMETLPGIPEGTEVSPNSLAVGVEQGHLIIGATLD